MMVVTSTWSSFLGAPDSTVGTRQRPVDGHLRQRDERPGHRDADLFARLVTIDCGVLYFGSDLETCFGETLARLRPSSAVLAVVEEEWRARGFMDAGTVAADWRQRRTAVHIRLPEDVLFLDAEWPTTHQFLRQELALGLSALGFGDLDVAAVRGPDRRVTRLIADWAYLAEDEGRPRYAGVRYESRLRSGWECWALFDDEDMELEVIETLPVTREMPALQRVAELFELRVF
jgi:hypothetical protein